MLPKAPVALPPTTKMAAPALVKAVALVLFAMIELTDSVLAAV